MIEIKESDLVPGFFWDDDKEHGFHGMLLCKKPSGKYGFVSFESGAISVWKNFEPKKEPEYVPWESVKDAPAEFFDGWIKIIPEAEVMFARKISAVNLKDNGVLFGDRWFNLSDLYSFGATWSPTFNGEYKLCGKPKD